MKPEKHIHGFKAPKDYFDNLEERIMQKIELEILPQQTGMSVPNNYFEQLESRIVTNVKKTTKIRKEPKLVTLNIGWYVLAAACTILFSLWILPEKPNSNLISDPLYVEADYTVEHYIEDMLIGMPDSNLFNLIEDADIQTSFGEDLDKKEIEEYLMENLDLDTLLSYE